MLLTANSRFNFGKDVIYERYRPDRQHVGAGGRHGLWMGNWKLYGVGLGIGGVLFGGILVGHFAQSGQISLNGDMLHFIQEFGLILFVYTIGIQVGPGFFSSLRVSGLRLNAFAVLLVLTGGVVAAAVHKLFDVPLPIILGVFSGAVTNTPALGAGQQI